MPTLTSTLSRVALLALVVGFSSAQYRQQANYPQYNNQQQQQQQNPYQRQQQQVGVEFLTNLFLFFSFLLPSHVFTFACVDLELLCCAPRSTTQGWRFQGYQPQQQNGFQNSNNQQQGQQNRYQPQQQSGGFGQQNQQPQQQSQFNGYNQQGFYNQQSAFQQQQVQNGAASKDVGRSAIVNQPVILVSSRGLAFSKTSRVRSFQSHLFPRELNVFR